MNIYKKKMSHVLETSNITITSKPTIIEEGLGLRLGLGLGLFSSSNNINSKTGVGGGEGGGRRGGALERSRTPDRNVEETQELSAL